MNQVKPTTPPLGPTPRDNAVEYLFDMIHQLAQLARSCGEAEVAIHLEAIIAARRATAKGRSA